MRLSNQYHQRPGNAEHRPDRAIFTQPGHQRTGRRQCQRSVADLEHLFCLRLGHVSAQPGQRRLCHQTAAIQLAVGSVEGKSH